MTLLALIGATGLYLLFIWLASAAAAAWLSERSGERRAAPKKLGSRSHKAMAKAPGTYVHAN